MELESNNNKTIIIIIIIIITVNNNCLQLLIILFSIFDEGYWARMSCAAGESGILWNDGWILEVVKMISEDLKEKDAEDRELLRKKISLR